MRVDSTARPGLPSKPTRYTACVLFKRVSEVTGGQSSLSFPNPQRPAMHWLLAGRCRLGIVTYLFTIK